MFQGRTLQIAVNDPFQGVFAKYSVTVRTLLHVVSYVNICETKPLKFGLKHCK